MTAVQRQMKQRKLRKEAGWECVKVWVPTKEDGDLVRNLGKKLRAEHKQREHNKKPAP